MGESLEKSNHRFLRQERLKKKKSIDLLFKNGRKYISFPIILYYLADEPESPHFHKALFSVPKKHFKSAVVRNKIRRRMRESFRINKQILYNSNSGVPILMAYVYISKNVLSYKEIETKVIDCLNHLKLKNNKI